MRDSYFTIYSTLACSLFISTASLASDFATGELVFKKSDIAADKLKIESVVSDVRGRTCLKGAEDECSLCAELISLKEITLPSTPDQKVSAQNILKVTANGRGDGGGDYFQVSYVIKSPNDGQTYLLGHYFSYTSEAFKDFLSYSDLKVLISGLFEHTRLFYFGAHDLVKYIPQNILVADDEQRCLELKTRTVCQNTQYGEIGLGFIFKNSTHAVLCAKNYGCGTVDLGQLSEVEETHLFSLNDLELLQVLVTFKK